MIPFSDEGLCGSITFVCLLCLFMWLLIHSHLVHDGMVHFHRICVGFGLTCWMGGYGVSAWRSNSDSFLLHVLIRQTGLFLLNGELGWSDGRCCSSDRTAERLVLPGCLFELLDTWRARNGELIVVGRSGRFLFKRP